MSKISKNKNLQKFIHITLAILLVIVIYPRFASAAALTALSDTMERMKDSVDSNHTIQFTIPASDDIIENETITVTFAAGFDLAVNGTDCGAIDLEDDTVDEDVREQADPDCNATATEWGAAISGQVITLTAPSTASTYINTTSVVVIKIGSNANHDGANTVEKINNQTVAENNTDQKISINADGDTGTIAVEIVANDQVTVQTV